VVVPKIGVRTPALIAAPGVAGGVGNGVHFSGLPGEQDDPGPGLLGPGVGLGVART
jgi:hypothetical protein